MKRCALSSSVRHMAYSPCAVPRITAVELPVMTKLLIMAEKRSQPFCSPSL